MENAYFQSMKPKNWLCLLLFSAFYGCFQQAHGQAVADSLRTSSFKLHLTEPLFSWARVSWEQTLGKGVSVQGTTGYSWRSLEPGGRMLQWVWVGRRAWSFAAGPRFCFVKEIPFLSSPERSFRIRWFFQPQLQFLSSDFNPYQVTKTDFEFSEGERYWKTIKVQERMYGLHFLFGYSFNRGHFLSMENYFGFGLNWVVRDEAVTDFDPRVTPANPFFSTGFLNDGRSSQARVALLVGSTLNFDFAALR